MRRRNTSAFNLALAALFAMLLLTGAVFATTVMRMELPQLVKQSDSIIQGYVDDVTVQWDSTRNLAFTYITVSVEDPMKGDHSRTVTIRQLGGKVGALNVSVAGMPKFTKGEEVIVFLKGAQDGTFYVLGLNQGKYQIDHNFAISNVSGIDVYNPKTGRIETPAFVDKAPVDAFKAKIRELLK
jgi:hypothetical protein